MYNLKNQINDKDKLADKLERRRKRLGLASRRLSSGSMKTGLLKRMIMMRSLYATQSSSLLFKRIGVGSREGEDEDSHDEL
ncbi:hypothetical protein IFM89_018688 [Coptis chinensis]|uniref:Uncharacterized protein n=1 Tax=Coptis chinensis TaxID=261450 RepID=A0A835M2X6_9MAGN|nr:hypothetical protein IFM89_018688 [Coptis chinensis]